LSYGTELSIDLPAWCFETHNKCFWLP